MKKPETESKVVKGWVLKTKDGAYLYRGNANKEFRNMRTGSFWFECALGCLPMLFATKREAAVHAKDWNSLVDVRLERWVGQDGKPMPAIRPETMVKPVRVSVTLDEL